MQIIDLCSYAKMKANDPMDVQRHVTSSNQSERSISP